MIIEGTGRATYFSGAPGAIVSAGSQTNWIFANFRVEANNSINVSNSSAWIKENIWEGTSYLSLIVNTEHNDEANYQIQSIVTAKLLTSYTACCVIAFLQNNPVVCIRGHPILN